MHLIIDNFVKLVLLLQWGQLLAGFLELWWPLPLSYTSQWYSPENRTCTPTWLTVLQQPLYGHSDFYKHWTIYNGHILKHYSPNTFTMQWHCNTGMITYSPYTRLDTNLLHTIMGLFPVLLRATPIWLIVVRRCHRPMFSVMLLIVSIRLIALQPLV